MPNWLIDGSLSKKKMRGMGRFSFELIKFLSEDQSNNLVVVVNNIDSYRFLYDEFKSQKNMTVVCIPIFFPIFEQVILPLIRLRYFRSIYVSGGDSYSICSFFGENIFLLHDIYFLKNSLFVDKIFHKVLGRFYRRFVFFFAIFGARHVVTVSNFTSSEVINMFPRLRGTFDRKLVVVENGTNFRNFQTPIAERTFDLVFVTGLDPQKRFCWAIQQLENFYRKLRICVVGICENDGVSSKHEIAYQGVLAAEEVEACLNDSKVLLVPSIDESFGVPVIEGLACGCNVVCSDSGALTSTGGRFPFRFEPNSKASFLSNISFALNSSNGSPMDFDKQLFDPSWNRIFSISLFRGCSK